MKRTLSIALALILILASVGASCAFAGGSYLGTLTVINCREWVSLRSAPNKNSPRVAAVPLGACVEAYYYNSEFTECYYNGCRGYILSTYLSNGSGGGSSAGGSNYLGERTIVNCNEFVTLRSTPSTKAPAVTRVALGETVQCYEYSSEFVYCYYNGLSGYILTKYISGMSSGSYGYGSGNGYDDGLDDDFWVNKEIKMLSSDKLWAVASSELTDQYGAYPASQACDGYANTVWSEGVNGFGEGEWLEIRFDPTYILDFMIYGGYQKDSYRYYKNNRPRKLEVWTDDEYQGTIELDDDMAAQYFGFNNPVYTSSLRLKILSAYAGSEYDDTCISEVCIFGYA